MEAQASIAEVNDALKVGQPVGFNFPTIRRKVVQADFFLSTSAAEL